MAADQKLQHLGRVRMFASLSKKELGLIAKAAEVVRFPAGEEIVREGEIGREFYLILAGTAVVRRNGRKVAGLDAGRYFGEMALLDRGPRSATVVAESDCELLVLGQREFSAVMEQVPALSHKLLVAMAARLREADNRAVSH